MASYEGRQPIQVLLVEDNPGDIRLVREGLASSGVPVSLNVVQDGAEALTYLRGQRVLIGSSRPSLIILDLNLPKRTGHEVLAEIRAHPGLKRIPVVILTASSAPFEINKSYDLCANSYVTKPGTLEEFMRAIRAIAEFWLTVARLPTE